CRHPLIRERSGAMDILAAATATDFEATVFLDYFKDMPDHRQRGKVAYRLDEILLLALLSILAGTEGFTDMARYRTVSPLRTRPQSYPRGVTVTDDQMASLNLARADFHGEWDCTIKRHPTATNL